MSAAGEVLAHAASDRGMGVLEPAAFEPALLALIDGWLGTGTTAVIACGMVGARQGWIEAAYSAVPCAPLAISGFACPATCDPRLDVRIVPGLQQGSPPDVMRGEETQIAGLLARNPDYAGAMCLPGTHSKWAWIEAGRVTRFQTFMTGEMFALLTDHSVLRHSVGTGWDDDAFATAVEAARDGDLLGRIFGIRAGGLIGGLSPGAARATLSGLLIGAELHALRPGGPVILIGESTLAAHYARALSVLGHASTQIGAEAATLDGLRGAWRCHNERSG